MRALSTLAEDFELSEGNRYWLSAIRTAHPPHLARKSYDWSFADETFERLRDQDDADRRPLSFRRSRLDPAIFRTLIGRRSSQFTRGICARDSPGSSCTRRSTRFHLRARSPRYGWWNERSRAIGLRHRAQAFRQGQCSCHGSHPRRSPGCHVHPKRVDGVLSRRRSDAIGPVEFLNPGAFSRSI